MTRGLTATKTLPDVGKDGSRGRLDLGLSASAASGARAHLGFAYQIERDRYNVAAFADSFAAMTRAGGHFTADYGVMAGLRLEW